MKLRWQFAAFAYAMSIFALASVWLAGAAIVVVLTIIIGLAVANRRLERRAR